MNKRFIFCLLICMLLVLATNSIQAEVYDFESLLTQGLENNIQVEEKRDALRNIEREREMLKANLDWHFGFDGDLSYRSKGPTFNIPSILDEEKNMDLSLSANKTTLSGISISSGLFLNDDQPFEFRDFEDKYSFRLNISKRLYPVLPSDTERGFIQRDNQLLMAEAELESIKKEKEIEWLGQYLELITLKKNIEIVEQSYQLAEDNLANVQAQFKIGETGQEQLLMAEISLKEARIQLGQLKLSFAQARNSFALELGIDNSSLAFDSKDNYLNSFAKRMKTIELDFTEEEVEELLLNNNLQLKNLDINIEYARKELEWQQKEDSLKIDGSAGYNYHSEPSDGSVNLSLGLSYDFHDGGRHDLTIQGMESDIEGLESQFDNTIEQLKLQYASLQEEYQISEMRLATNELSVQKAELKLLQAQRQLAEGFITEKQYQEILMELERAELTKQEIEDTLLLDKMQIAFFLGII